MMDAKHEESTPAMKVLAVGLPRTGTLSMAEALTILGYKNVHHSLNHLDDDNLWRLLGRAADASFPVLPSYTGETFTREQWEDIYGGCEAATESVSVFAPQLVDIYPEAKVILVVRDFDPWFKSVNDILFRGLWTPLGDVFANVVHPLLGICPIKTMRKMTLGFFEARTVDEARRNARDVHLQHEKRLRQTLPPERLLVYRMGEGWEPICQFLEKPVPREAFPWINEADALKKKTGKILQGHLVRAGGVVAPYAVGVALLGVLGVALWMMSSPSG